MRVTYNGINIEAPSRVRYIAVDTNGEIYGYQYKPSFKDGSWCPQQRDNPMRLYVTKTVVRDASKTLMKIAK